MNFNTFFLHLAQFFVPSAIAATWLFWPLYVIHIDREKWDALTTSEQKRLIQHEQVHIQQREREGIIFLFRYAFYHLTRGYKKNPYEIEAYANS